MCVENFLAAQRAPVSRALLAERCYASAFAALQAQNDVMAERLFGCLAMLAPRDARAWLGLAVCQERADKWRAAAGLYGVGAALSSESAWCWLGRARACRKLGMHAKAEHAFDAAEQGAGDALLVAHIDTERRNP